MLRTRVKAGPIAGLVMSLLCAVVLTALAAGDHFVERWAPAMGEPTSVSLRVPYGPRLVRDHITGRSDVEYTHANVVVPRGTVLRAEDTEHWTAYLYDAARRPPSGARLLGLFAVFFTITMVFTAYLRSFGRSRLRVLRVQIGLVVLTTLLAIVAKGLLLFSALPQYWIPIAAVSLWVASSFDRRTAFLVTTLLSFQIALLLGLDLVLLGVMLATGMGAALSYLDRKHSRHMILSGFISGLFATVLFVALMMMFEGRFDLVADALRLEQSSVVGCLGGGLFGGLLAAVLRSPAARLLGHVPRDRLVDLSDLGQPLLVKLSHEAPGTYEHSRAMANLAEQAASAVGADALLTRVGAYYHDLGKTVQAKYFVENLGPDERSPHDELDPEVSADAIMAHVVVGTRILRESGVPEAVVEFAYTHHGTQVVEYFWNKCLQQGNPKDLTQDAFSYPGMKPQTKETAIVMLVDSIEAASRTVDPPERAAFEQMIQRIVFTKVQTGQLDESDLNMLDLNTIVTRMADTLVNMHHHRIKYQWQAQRAEEFGVPSSAVHDSVPDIEVRSESSRPPPSGEEESPPPIEELSSTLEVAKVPDVRPVRDPSEGKQ